MFIIFVYCPDWRQSDRHHQSCSLHSFRSSRLFSLDRQSYRLISRSAPLLSLHEWKVQLWYTWHRECWYRKQSKEHTSYRGRSLGDLCNISCQYRHSSRQMCFPWWRWACLRSGSWWWRRWGRVKGIGIWLVLPLQVQTM